MPLDPQTGAITINNGQTVATLSGVNLSDFRTGDTLSAGTENRKDVAGVDDQAGTVTFYLPWAGGNQTAGACVLRPDAPSRFDDVAIDQRTLRILQIIESTPFDYTVPPSETPNNNLGDENQTAVRYFPLPVIWYQKVAGVWILRGSLFNLSFNADYDNGASYASGAVVNYDGIMYLYINVTPSAGHLPPASPTYWKVFLKGGDKYDICSFDTDRPASGELIGKWVAPRTTTFLAGLADSIARAEVAATSSAVFSLTKNGAQFATLTFGAASATGVFACASDAAFARADILRMIAPNPRDATLSGVAGTLVGSR